MKKLFILIIFIISGMHGLCDEVAVFSRALSTTEVAAIYANGLTGNKGGSD